MKLVDRMKLADRISRLLERKLDPLRLQLGWLQSREVRSATGLRDAEFRVYSQFGEDGIIQFLTHRIPIKREIFVEFGVWDYSESNTRFLLEQDNWRGLIIDAGAEHQTFLERSGLGWRHTIDAVSAFVDRDNINALISGAGIEGDIGLLSIDIDGNDYWVLEAIDVVSPRILAGLISMPLLTAIFDVVAIYGAFVVGVQLLGVSSGSYFAGMELSVVFKDVLSGFLKSVSFGLIITWICCYKGFNAPPMATGVGQATTESVVLCFVMILVWNYFMTSIML